MPSFTCSIGFGAVVRSLIVASAGITLSPGGHKGILEDPPEILDEKSPGDDDRDDIPGGLPGQAQRVELERLRVTQGWL
jgi:hypothetical protein